MHLPRRTTTYLLSIALLSGILLVPARGSDPPETSTLASTPGENLCDLYLFPSPANNANVVLVMTLHPFIQSGQAVSTVFDPNVLYQFKIDTTGDAVEDLVVQAKFTGTGSNQQVQIAGPLKPSKTGSVNVLEKLDSVTGTINTAFTLSNGVKVFAGAAEDPLFFDINQFFTMLPDRASPLGPNITNTSGVSVSTSPADPNLLQASAWRPVLTAQDFLKGLNILAIVVEVPKTLLSSTGTGKINVWCTTSR